MRKIVTTSLWPDFEGIFRLGYSLVGTINALVVSRDRHLVQTGQTQRSNCSEPWPQNTTKQEKRLLRLIDQISEIRAAQSAMSTRDSQFDIDRVLHRRSMEQDAAFDSGTTCPEVSRGSTGF